jgi:hypothetical protein
MTKARTVFGVKLKGFRWRSSLVPAIALGLMLAALPLAAQDKKDADADKQDNDSIGFVASKNAGAKDIGLPLYPGSRKHKDSSDDSASVQLGAWGGSSGFKLVVLKMDSDDAPDKVTAFYRKALSKYGKVLNCSDSGAAAAAKEKSANGLDCEEDHADENETVLKAGTKEAKHIVSVKPNGSGSIYDLVYIEARGSVNSK